MSSQLSPGSPSLAPPSTLPAPFNAFIIPYDPSIGTTRSAVKRKAESASTGGVKKQKQNFDSFLLWHDGQAVYVRVDMPGVDGKNIKCWLDDEKCQLQIEAQEENIPSSFRNVGDQKRNYSYLIKLPLSTYKTKEILMRMDNGVLRAVLPIADIKVKGIPINCSANEIP